jgi:hypothetical protein
MKKIQQQCKSVARLDTFATTALPVKILFPYMEVKATQHMRLTTIASFKSSLITSRENKKAPGRTKGRAYTPKE